MTKITAGIHVKSIQAYILVVAEMWSIRPLDIQMFHWAACEPSDTRAKAANRTKIKPVARPVNHKAGSDVDPQTRNASLSNLVTGTEHDDEQASPQRLKTVAKARKSLTENQHWPGSMDGNPSPGYISCRLVPTSDKLKALARKTVVYRRRCTLVKKQNTG